MTLRSVELAEQPQRTQKGNRSRGLFFVSFVFYVAAFFSSDTSQRREGVAFEDAEAESCRLERFSSVLYW